MIRSFIKLAYDKQKSLARSYVRRVRNPGIGRQLALLKDDQLEQANFDEHFSELEDADFTQLHKSHKQYESETIRYQERLQSWIVGNKYFKTKQLNFLTWSEKEQIRYLHNLDPEEWGIDKLVESFPADRYTIAKIVKARWIPRDGKRISRHDEAVRENWEMFKSGRIKNIDEAFAEHLNKFVHRNMQDVQNTKVETKRLYEIRQTNVEGEFSQIITSCPKYASNDLSQTEFRKIGEDKPDSKMPEIRFRRPDNDMFIIGKINDNHPKTLQQIKDDSSTATDLTSNTTEVALTGTNQKINSLTWENIKKYNSAMVSTEEKQPASDNTIIQEYIKIPKKLYRKGATYQLDDCFYDDDGEFLYRVPGMTGKKINDS